MRRLKTAYQVLMKDSKKDDTRRFIYPYETPHTTTIEFYSKYLPGYILQTIKKGIINEKLLQHDDADLILNSEYARSVDFHLPIAIDVVNNKL